MVLGFLAVEAPWHVELMLVRQGHGSGRRQRNTLVGRAEQHVERDLAVDDGCGIAPPQFGQCRTGVEQAGIEEIRAGTPRFQGEFTETQYPAIDGKTDKVALIRLHE